MKKELYESIVDLLKEYESFVEASGSLFSVKNSDAGKKTLKVIKKYEKHGWKDHDGSDACPVGENKRVKVKLRDGEVLCELAKYFYWEHKGCDGDIIKYKVVKKGK